MTRRSRILAALLLAIAPSMAFADETGSASPQAALVAVLAAYGDATPIAGPLGLDDAGAESVQRMAVLNLRPRWGEVAGYKAALTSAAARARFGADQPLSGMLLENMFTTTGATVSLRHLVRPLLEVDLLVRVADDAIGQATTTDEVLAALGQVIPFLEIPDLMFADPSVITSADIRAVNAGARLGVMGAPVPVTEATAAQLAAMTVELLDGDGRTLVQADGSALMGHPLNAALWLVTDLARRGETLKAGDLLSLGSLGPPLPLTAPGRVRALYHGLAEQPLVIDVGFRR